MKALERQALSVFVTGVFIKARTVPGTQWLLNYGWMDGASVLECPNLLSEG